jgi:hypothetical protein
MPCGCVRILNYLIVRWRKWFVHTYHLQICWVHKWFYYLGEWNECNEFDTNSIANALRMCEFITNTFLSLGEWNDLDTWHCKKALILEGRSGPNLVHFLVYICHSMTLRDIINRIASTLMHEFIILYVFKVRLKRKFDTSTFINKAWYLDSLLFDVTIVRGADVGVEKLWLLSSQWRQWNPKAGGKLTSNKCPFLSCWQDLNNQSSPITSLPIGYLQNTLFHLSDSLRALLEEAWIEYHGLQYLSNSWLRWERETQTGDYCLSLRLQIRPSSSVTTQQPATTP